MDTPETTQTETQTTTAEPTKTDHQAKLAEMLGAEDEPDAPAPAEEEAEEAPPPVEEPAPEPRLAKGLKLLAKREQELRAERAKFREEAKQLEGLKAQLGSLIEMDRRLKDDPIGFLRERGLTFEQLADAELKKVDPKPKTPEDDIKELREKLLALEEEKKTEAQRQTERQRQESLKLAERGVRAAVAEETAAGKYEAIAAFSDDTTDAPSMVFDTMVTAFHRGADFTLDGKRYRYQPGSEIPLDLACRLVDRYLMDQARKGLSIKSLRSAPQAPADAEPPAEGARAAKPPRTLSNRKAAAPSAPSDPYDGLSDSEMLAQAIKDAKKGSLLSKG